MIKFISLICMTFALTQCGSSSDPSSGSSSELDGTWKGTCKADTSANEYSWGRHVFDGSSYTYIDTTNKLDGCSSASRKVEYYSTYEFEAGETTNGKTKADFTLEMIKVTVYDEDTLDNFNSLELCDKGDWELKKSVEVTGKKCSDDLVFDDEGTQYFDIYKITGDKLQFGDSSGGLDSTSKAKRPTTLDSDKYTKAK